MFRTFYKLTKKSISEFFRLKVSRLGAALAFQSILSLSSLLLMGVGITGVIFGKETATGEIFAEIRDIVGDEAAQAIQTMLTGRQVVAGGWITAIVGITTLLWTSSSIFFALQDALDTIWEVAPDADETTRKEVLITLRDRVLALVLVFSVILILIASLILTALLTATTNEFNRWLPQNTILIGLGHTLLFFLLSTLLFALIFKILPRRSPPWHIVWLGAVITAFLFTIGNNLIGLYLGRAAVSSTYGAAGSFMALLIWIYYSIQILLLGAVFIKIYSKAHSSSALLKNQGNHA